MNKRLIVLLLTTIFVTQVQAAPTSPARNKDGSIVTGILAAAFDPSKGVLPFPHNLLFTGTKDLTLNPPVANPSNIGDPAVALSTLDGFSTTEKWVASFLTTNDNGTTYVPGTVDPASVVPGQSVRLFQVTTQQFLAVTSIVRELTPGLEFTAVASGSNVAIIPVKPLKQYSSYMAVLTNDIHDMAGNDATPSGTYFLTKRRTSWLDASGQSVYPLLPTASAQALEPLRQITQSMELNFAAYTGIDPDDVVLSWTVQTQSIQYTLGILRSIAAPMPVLAAPSGLNTVAIGGFGLADIVVGVITLPYYSGIPSAANPIAPLTDYWKAPAGGYIPPFDQFGLDPTSTNLTIANPIPELSGTVTVPLIMTVPSAASGFTKPAEGWPVVIFVHGITRNRTDMLAVADSFARAGYAVIAIDLPLHGVVPAVDPQLTPFYVENTPFGPFAGERTFDSDYWNNQTGAPGPDGVMDSSGASFFNLGNLLAVRDNLRQAQVDLSTLAVSLQSISYDGDTVPDLNTFNVGVVGQSLGVFPAVGFAAVEPIVSRAYLNVGGAIALRTVEAGFFGTQIRAGLAAAGVLPGTAAFEQFMTVGQTILDSPDPANWAADLTARIPVLHNQVYGDLVVPNTVAGAPMAGNEGLNWVLGLNGFSSTQANPSGVRGVARFLPPAQHESLLSPAASLAATAEMQGQMVSFIASGGQLVNVGNPDLLLPVIPVELESAENVSVRISGKAGKSRSPVNPVVTVRQSRGYDND